MRKLTGSQIRQLWLDFFSSKGHEIIPSASLIPYNDPTLLWINAGVAPLKKYFDGREIPTNPRMCNAQKSIRTNDIDNVGKTARHHTFFEMLGNFSIGDYFRDEALTWAYELLFSDKWYGFDKEKIYITYYPDDTETFNKWVSLGIEKHHLVAISDNFWEIGEGPCGPDTEIFYDRGEKYDPNHLGLKMLIENIENDRYIEIWNIVFSQYNSILGLKRSEYPELPSKNIDTGSGLERLACIFQETQTNYETDLFMPLIAFIEEKTGRSYNNPDDKMAFRVIADHIRSVTFAVADGAIISNEGRGYVLRRILRRAVRYGKKLGLNQPFLYQMVDVVIEKYKDFYNYLVEKQEIIKKIVHIEEENFLKTLSTGEKKIADIMANSTNQIISGKDAFLLYDTFGFPIELSEEVANDNGFSIDIVGFKKELEEQKNRARKARNVEQSMNVQNEEYLNFTTKSDFVGYSTLNAYGKIIAIFKEGKSVEEGTGILQIVLDKTPFYAQMGGQIGDQGILLYQEQNFHVLDTLKLPNGQHVHVVDFKEQVISVGENVYASVNEEFRKAVSQNHTATHLLNQALREVLGNHVAQHGSQVTNENLRFDFNHYQNLTIEEIIQLEEVVRREIEANHSVKIIETTVEEAKARGAQAIFGEKYGKIVRLVDMDYSKELCGGTHLTYTGEIKNFAITSVESKGSGIFRIEAVASDNLLDEVAKVVSANKNEILEIMRKNNELYMNALKEGFKISKKEIKLPSIIGSYLDIVNYRETFVMAKKVQKDLEKEYETLKRNESSLDYKQFMNASYCINETKVVINKVKNMDLGVVKDIIDKIAADSNKCIVFFADIMEADNKLIFIAKSKNTKVNCGLLVKEAAMMSGGNGGGRPDFAQSGGKEITKVDEVIARVKEKIECDI